MLGMLRQTTVYQQMGENLHFLKDSVQVSQDLVFGENAPSGQYTIWGWFKFTGSAEGISQIVALNSYELEEVDEVNFKEFSLEDCPYTQQKLALKPHLRKLKEVLNNPNCNPVKGETINGKRYIRRNQEDILFINNNMNQEDGEPMTYNVLVKALYDRNEVGSKRMVDLQFDNQLYQPDVWNFIAVSADYERGELKAYFLPCTSLDSQVLERSTTLAYPGFKLNKDANLVFAGVESTNFFSSTSGFVGYITAVEVNLFYANKFNPFWINFIPETTAETNGIVLKTLLNNRGENRKLRLINTNNIVLIEGEFRNASADKFEETGAFMKPNSMINLGAVDFLNSASPIKTYNFFFKVLYSEDLPEDVILFTRGTESESGFMRVSLVKRKNGRVVLLEAQGDDQKISWEADHVLKPNKKYTVLTGLSIAPGGLTNVNYWDSNGNNTSISKAKRFAFDGSALPVTVLNNQTKKSYAGWVNLSYFALMNSTASALSTKIVRDSESDKLKTLARHCELNYNLQDIGKECLVCNKGFVNYQNNCEKCCPANYMNYSGFCVECKNGNCDRLRQQSWDIDRIEDDTFVLTPSIPLEKELPFKKPFIITEQGRENRPIDYKYDFNDERTSIEVELKNKRRIEDGVINFDYKQNPNKQICDAEGNTMVLRRATIEVKQICYVKKHKRRTMRALGITVLGTYGLSLLLLILFSVCCFRKITDLGGLWKFFLHNWMRLQMVAFFLLLAVYMPCCIKEFLNVLYRIVVKWDHAFGYIIDDSKENNNDFNKGLRDQRPPLRFAEQGVEAFILHNIMVAFIVHLFIFLVYLCVKAWDVLRSATSACMFKTFVLFEFTILIVGYLLVEMHIFVFAGLNYRLAIFSTAYFVICFLIAIMYIFVFVIFWVVAFIRIMGSPDFFDNINNYNRYYYFFAGYRDSKWARSYDLWLVLGYLVIGLMIGILIKSPLAQMIVITSVLAVLLLLTIMLRPWKSTVFWVVEIISQICILVAVVILLIMAVHDHDDCFDCGDREGTLCWLVVLFLFVGLMIAALGLIAGLFMALCRRTKKVVVVTEHNEFIQTSKVKDAEQSNHNSAHIDYKQEEEERMIVDKADRMREDVYNSKYGSNHYERSEIRDMGNYTYDEDRLYSLNRIHNQEETRQETVIPVRTKAVNSQIIESKIASNMISDSNFSKEPKTNYNYRVETFETRENVDA